MGSQIAKIDSYKTEQHPILGKIHINKTSDNNGIVYESMAVTRLVNSKQQFDKWHTNANKISNKILKQGLLLPNKVVFQSNQVCGTSGTVNLHYDYYPLILLDQIDLRRRHGCYFIESQLWYLLYILVQAANQFQQQHSKIGNIHPNNIVINQQGLVKLISTNSYPQQLTNFDKILEYPQHFVYLAPEQLIDFSVNKVQYPKNIDASLCQCFSIGLCMLAAGNLDQLRIVYGWDKSKMKIEQSILDSYLKSFEQRYGMVLYQIVKGLLSINPNNRKRCSQIYSMVSKYEKSILNLEPFELNSKTAYKIPYLQQELTKMRPFTINWYDAIPNRQGLRPIHSKANATNIYYYPSQSYKSQGRTLDQSAFQRQPSHRRVSLFNLA